jgi:hypothetical protein
MKRRAPNPQFERPLTSRRTRYDDAAERDSQLAARHARNLEIMEKQAAAAGAARQSETKNTGDK